MAYLQISLCQTRTLISQFQTLFLLRHNFYPEMLSLILNFQFSLEIFLFFTEHKSRSRDANTLRLLPSGLHFPLISNFLLSKALYPVLVIPPSISSHPLISLLCPLSITCLSIQEIKIPKSVFKNKNKNPTIPTTPLNYYTAFLSHINSRVYVPASFSDCISIMPQTTSVPPLSPTSGVLGPELLLSRFYSQWH